MCICIYILESRIFSIVIYYAFITSILTLVVNRFVDFQGDFRNYLRLIFVTRKDPFLKRVSKVAYDECSYLSSNDRRIRRTIMDERYNNTANHPSLRLDQSRVSRASLLSEASRSNSFTITKEEEEEEEADWQISHVSKFNPEEGGGEEKRGCNKIVKSIGRLIEGRLVVSRE